MKLLKDNSYEIVRLVINQVGITIFSLVLYTGLNMAQDSGTTLSIRILLSVFATLFYLILLYNAGWEYGSKDKLKVEAGKFKAVPLKGAIMSLVANSVNILMAFSVVAFMSLYLAFGAEWLYTVSGVIIVIIRFTSAMYLGIVQGIFSWLPEGSSLTYLLETIGYGLLPLLAIAATQLGYSFGMHDFRIVSLFKEKKNDGDSHG